MLGWVSRLPGAVASSGQSRVCWVNPALDLAEEGSRSRAAGSRDDFLAHTTKHVVHSLERRLYSILKRLFESDGPRWRREQPTNQLGFHGDVESVQHSLDHHVLGYDIPT
jgi:hypothetical protein